MCLWPNQKMVPRFVLFLLHGFFSVLCICVCVCVGGGGGGGLEALHVQYKRKMFLLQVKLPPVPVVTEQESREHLLAAERRRMRFIHTYIISPSAQYYHVDFHSV